MNTALAKQTDQSKQEQTPFERLLSHRDSLREATAHVRPLVEAIQRYSDERSRLHASHNSSVEHTTHPISNGASSVEISAVRAALENQRLSLMNDRSAMSERYTKILTSLQSTPVTPETVPTSMKHAIELASLGYQHQANNERLTAIIEKKREATTLLITTLLRENNFPTEHELSRAVGKAHLAERKALGPFSLGKLFRPEAVRRAHAEAARLSSLEEELRKLHAGLPSFYSLPHDAPKFFDSDINRVFERPLIDRVGQTVSKLSDSVNELLTTSWFSPNRALEAELTSPPEQRKTCQAAATILKMTLRDRVDGSSYLNTLDRAESFIDANLRLHAAGDRSRISELARELDYETLTTLRAISENAGPADPLVDGLRPHLLWICIGSEISQVARLTETLTDITDPTRGCRNIRGLYELTWPVSRMSRCVEQNQEVLNNIPMWNATRLSPETPHLLAACAGIPIDEARDMVQSAGEAHTLLGTLIVKSLMSTSNKEQRIGHGYQLMSLRDPELLPLQLINAFREPGHSGEWPFMNNSAWCSIIARLSHLSDADVAALKAHPCPNVYALALHLQEHGVEANYLYKQSSSTLEINPPRVTTDAHLESIALHYLQHGSEREQAFMADLVARIHSGMSPAIAAKVTRIFEAPSGDRLTRDWIEYVASSIKSKDGHRFGDPLIWATLLAIDRTSWRGETTGTEYAALFFRHLSPAGQSDPTVVRVMAKHLNVSEAALTLVREGVPALIAAGLLEDTPLTGYNSHHTRFLQNAAKLVNIPGMLESAQQATSLAGRPPEAARGIIQEIATVVLEDKKPGQTITRESFEQACQIFGRICAARNYGTQVNYAGRDNDRLFQECFTSLYRIAKSPDRMTLLADQTARSPEDLFYALAAINTIQSPADFITPETLPLLHKAFPKHTDSRALAEIGAPLLNSLGWLTPENMVIFAERFPQFVRENASSQDAWAAHRANLAQGRAAFLTSSPLSVDMELQKLLEFQRDFPNTQLHRIYEVFRMIGQPEAAATLREMGFSHTDRRVIHEIKTRIQKLRDSLLSSEGPLEVKTPFEQDLLVSLIGYGGDGREIHNRTELYNAQHAKGDVSQLAAGFQDHRITVNALDLEKVRAFAFSEPTRHKYSDYVAELSHLRGRSLQQVVSDERVRVTDLLTNVESDLERSLQGMELSPGERKGREIELERTRKTLNKIEKSESLTELLSLLCDYKQKDNPISTPSVRRITLRMALDEVSNEDSLYGLLTPDPSKEALEAIVGLVSQRLKEEALARYEIPPKYRKSIGLAASTASFQEDLARLSQIDVAGKETIVVHPTRGLLGELSGFNCDACWTRETGIMARYPNATALMFVRDPDDDSRKRVVGACIVIKVKDTEGNETFVVRGLNPTQNFITQLNAESFFESFIDTAVVPMARAQGIKRIVIPSEPSSGSSQTNRPSLNLYIQSNYGQNPRVPLDQRGPSPTFNRYEIFDKCVLVRELCD